MKSSYSFGKYFRILGLGALILFLASSSIEAQSLRKIRIGYPSLSLLQELEAEGFFNDMEKRYR